MSKRGIALGLVLLAAGVYANALANGFVWDDSIILARQLPVFQSPLSVLWPPANIPQFAPDYYRPLVIGTYLVDQSIGGGEAWAFHLTVVLAHVLATLAVFALGDEIFRRAPGTSAQQAAIGAGVGAALFAVHPIHTEAVAWIAGRADVFAGLFGATAAWAHLRSQREPRLAWVAGAALLLALMSKEVAISLVLVLPALDLLRADAPTAAPAAPPRAQRRRSAPPAATGAALTGFSLARYAPLAAALALYAGLRLSATHGGIATRSGEMEGAFLPNALVAIAAYVQRLVLPVELNAYIAELPVSGLTIVAGAVILVVFTAALAVAVRRGWWVIAVLMLWPAVTLAPSLTILFKIPEVPLAERYLYLPSVGVCLLVGYGAALAWFSPRRELHLAAGAFVAVLLLAGVVSSVARNRVWASDFALWSDTAAKSPNAGMAFRSLGVALYKENKIDEAEEAYEKALERRNTTAGLVTIYNNLGTIALTRGALDQAESFYRKAVALQPSPDAVYNVGVIALRRAQQAKDGGDASVQLAQANAALDDLVRVEGVSPHDPDVQLALGQALELSGRQAEARSRFERALALGLSGENAEQLRKRLAEK